MLDVTTLLPAAVTGLCSGAIVVIGLRADVRWLKSIVETLQSDVKEVSSAVARLEGSKNNGN